MFISMVKIFVQIAPLEMYDRVLNTSLKWFALNHLSVILHGYKYLQWHPICKTIVTRNKIVWRLAHGYCSCYWKTFSLVPDSAECTIFFSPKSAVHYFYQLKSNIIKGQRKTTNAEKHFYPWLTSLNLKLSCT